MTLWSGSKHITFPILITTNNKSLFYLTSLVQSVAFLCKSDTMNICVLHGCVGVCKLTYFGSNKVFCYRNYQNGAKGCERDNGFYLIQQKDHKLLFLKRWKIWVHQFRGGIVKYDLAVKEDESGQVCNIPREGDWQNWHEQQLQNAM